MIHKEEVLMTLYLEILCFDDSEECEGESDVRALTPSLFPI